MAVLVATRGTGPEHGLCVLDLAAPAPARLLAKAPSLAAVAVHPALPIVYAVGEPGLLWWWRLARDARGQWYVDSPGRAAASDGAVQRGGMERPGGPIPTRGIEPCHVAVSPDGALLVVTNYGSGSVSAWVLDADGEPTSPTTVRELEPPRPAPGPDPERQEASHPHQAVFTSHGILVVDLGADRIVSLGAGVGLPVQAAWALPAGSGPRHLVELPDGRLAVSAELSAQLLVGRLGGDWHALPCGDPTRPPVSAADGLDAARVRTYPGDVARSPDGRHVYLANRGRDTIATFAVDGDEPLLLAEASAGVTWVQHLLVRGDRLLVAGERGGGIAELALRDGVAGEVLGLTPAAGACWLTRLPG